MTTKPPISRGLSEAAGVVCACLEASPLLRPFLALIPPALVLPAVLVRLCQGDGAGRFVADLIVYPALTAAAAYFAFALAQRSKGKPKPLRDSA